MGLRFSRNDVELMIKLLGHESARQKLKQIEDQIGKKLPSAGQRAGNVLRKGMAVTFGAMGKLGTDYLRTLKSAFLRTFSYGIINIVRQSMADVSKTIKETADLSLNFARVASIMTKGVGNTQQVYDNLVTSILKADKNTMLFTNDIKEMGLAIAKGGVATTEEFNAVLDVLNGLVGASGENSDQLALQFLKMAKALGIGKDQYQEFGDMLYTVSTSATVQIQDLLSAAGNVGPLMKLSYGKGMESAKNFAVSVAAAAQQGTRASRVGTSLRRMMDKLAAPTSEALGVMTKYGIQLYRDSNYSSKFSMALREQHRRLRDLSQELERLTSTEINYTRAGTKEEELIGIREKIADVQQRIKEETEAGTRIFEQFVDAGGEMKTPLAIAKEFNKLLEDGTINTMQFTEALTEIIGRRGMIAPIGLIAGFEEMLEIEEKADSSLGSIGKSLEFITKEWGWMAREAYTALDKIKTTIGLIFGAGVVGPIVNNIRKNILQPVSDSLTEDEFWNTLSKSMADKVNTLFSPLTKKVGQLVQITFFPDAKMTEEDRDKKMRELSNEILGFFKPLTELLQEGISSLGNTLGKAFINGVMEGLKASVPNLTEAFKKFSPIMHTPVGWTAEKAWDITSAPRNAIFGFDRDRSRDIDNNATLSLNNLAKKTIPKSPQNDTSGMYTVGGVGYNKLEEAAKIAGYTKQEIEVAGDNVSNSVKDLINSMNGMLGDIVTVIENGDLKLKENWQRQITDLRVNRK